MDARRFRPGSLALSILAALTGAPAAQDDGGTSTWNRFRGPNGSGLAEGSYPTEIGPDSNVLWKRAFPAGHSSPVFGAKLLFLTGVEDDKLFTYAIDRETGATVWQRQAPRPRRTRFHGKNGPAAASAAVDGDTVVVFFDEYGMLAYDHAGEERWRLPLGPFHNIYGMGASPIIAGNVVVQPCDDGHASFVIGLDKRSGDELWRVDRPQAVSGHCTPIIYEPADGDPQFILPGSFLLDAYDIKTGERIWWITGLPSEMKSVPVLLGDTLWIHGFGSPLNNRGRQVELPGFEPALAAMDANGDKLIARAEVTNDAARRYFVYIDADGNGTMDAKEWSLLRSSMMAVNAAIAVRVGGHGDMTEKSVLWRYYRSIPQLPSPLIANGVYYLLADQGGLVTTLSPDKGELIEKGRVGEGGDAHFASPVAGDGKVYLLSDAGILTVLAAGKGLQPLHSADFGEECLATPALVDDSVWLRTMGHLYRFGSR